MIHRYGCDLPDPASTYTRLSDGRRFRIDRCPTCEAVAIQKEDQP